MSKPRTITITTTRTKANASIPWYVDTLSNTSVDWLTSQQASTWVSALPGVISYLTNVNPTETSRTSVLSIGYDPNDTNDPWFELIQQGREAYQSSTGSIGGTLYEHIRASINNSDYTNFMANLASHKTGHQIETTSTITDTINT
jgi:hypothetical protein